MPQRLNAALFLRAAPAAASTAVWLQLCLVSAPAPVCSAPAWLDCESSCSGSEACAAADDDAATAAATAAGAAEATAAAASELAIGVCACTQVPQTAAGELSRAAAPGGCSVQLNELAQRCRLWARANAGLAHGHESDQGVGRASSAQHATHNVSTTPFLCSKRDEVH